VWTSPFRPPEQEANTKKKASFVEGAPLLAVEVLSPNDKQKDISDAVEEYLDCGTKQVWIVDPYAETVTVYRSNVEPIMYARSQTLPGGDDLPGFACPVAEIFE
jgi:Uma2 family endonuclease